MNVTVVATGGSRGDVQPGMVLARALKLAGHGVVLAVTEDFAQMAAAYEVEVCPVRFNTRALVESIGGIEMIESEKNPVRLFRNLTALLKPMFEQTILDVTPVLKHTDLVLSHVGAAFCALSMAEVARLPIAIYVLALATPTREHPIATFPPAPDWFPFKTLYNRLTNQMAQRAIVPLVGRLINELRVEQLHLPPYSGSVLRTLALSNVMLHGISPAVIPRPADWPASSHMCGYWFEPDLAGWSPPPALAAFLEAGPPPIYVGFGSMASRAPEETTRLILEAVRQSGQRAVLASGWAGLRGADLPDSVFMLDEVSHRWLFPRVAATVHHGGAGTTAAAFRAGIPSVIVPHYADQFFWGDRAQRLGVSPKPIPRQKLHAPRLARAILQAVSDPQMRQRATELSDRLHAEDGAQRAVEVIEEMMG